MIQKIVLGLLVLMALGGLFIKGQIQSTPSGQTVLAAKNTASSSDLTQVDVQDGIKVTVTYLPEESSQSESTIRFAVTSDQDVESYDFAQKVEWADSNIDPLPTLSSTLIKKEPHDLEFKMSFVRQGSHHHLLVNDLGSIRHRIFHYYL